ncbi:nucleoside/nucleotide kinase family protein [Nocardioides sp. TRM66260-LWL]|uniref:nucleoside/nucleotide kinase family protein n=1 Tax=Nocardioides sp. TRM66260-LWL TaxID=2874478 RepID=UPI001CC3D12A|nr:nucleoside/nucleotide kinase family protein [Nocardioides sp. TRM66260-LWL]MBZ5733132.1 nucleoside/nucleotide kinase family protein [Nocardioides sp. TRM66260-LWL]
MAVAVDDLLADALALVGGLDGSADGSSGEVLGRRRVLLGLSGAPGAGKSTLVDALLAGAAAAGIGAAHVPMDGFHLADAQLRRLGRLGRKGAPDTFDVDGYVALLRRCRDEPDLDVYAPGFERDLEQPIAAALVVPAGVRLVLTEGNHLLLDDRPGARWSQVRPLLDAVWHLELDDAVRRERLVARHIASGKAPDAARAWVADVDEPTARLVRDAAPRADRRITLG